MAGKSNWEAENLRHITNRLLDATRRFTVEVANIKRELDQHIGTVPEDKEPEPTKAERYDPARDGP